MRIIGNSLLFLHIPFVLFPAWARKQRHCQDTFPPVYGVTCRQHVALFISPEFAAVDSGWDAFHIRVTFVCSVQLLPAGSKFALFGYLSSVATEVCDRGVSVTLCCPGPIATGSDEAPRNIFGAQVGARRCWH